MPLPIYDSQDAIPEAQREDYAEHEGKWRHKVEIELAAERAKRTKLLSEKKEEERLRKEAEQQREELKRAQDAREKGITEEQLKQIRDEEAKARKPIEDENAKLKSELRQLRLTDRVKAAALAAGVMPDRIDDAMLLLANRTDLTTDGDSIVVKDAKGNIVAGVELKDFLAKAFREEKPWLYAGSGASGSGAEGGGGGGGGTYDPVAAGKEAAKAQSAGREQNALAFR